MTRNALRPRSSALPLLALLGLAMSGAAAVAPDAVARTAAGQQAAQRPGASGPAAGSEPLLLINGTRLVLVAGPGGRPAALVLPSSGPSPSSSPAGFAPMITTSLAGHISDIPADALPFVGRGLDPSLFDLTALRRVEHAGRLPVRISYRGRVPALPGVTITRASAGTAAGYLTAKSAPKFGAALRHQFQADHDRAGYGTDGMFAGGVSIALAGAQAPARARPGFVMHTLVIHGIDRAGRPDNGDVVFLANADNPARFFSIFGSVFHNGVAKVSVPAGHYWAHGYFLIQRPAKFDNFFVFAPQFTVPAHGPNPRVSFDARMATSKLHVTTPRPGVLVNSGFTAAMRAKAGPLALAGGVIFGSHSDWWVNPTKINSRVGSVRTFTQAQLVSSPGPGVPYAYNLDFPGQADRIPPQHFTVRQSSLATVNENYFQDMPSAGFWATIGGSVQELQGFPQDPLLPLSLPGRRVHYLTGNPALAWISEYLEFNDTLVAGQVDSLRSLRAGQRVTENWNKYPLHPAPDVNLLRRAGASKFGAVVPSAARTGDLLRLGTDPFAPIGFLPRLRVSAFSDNTVGHLGILFGGGSGTKVTGHFEIDQNGTRLASGNAVTGIAPVRLSSHPSVIRFTLTASRTGQRFRLSPSNATTWTWRSRRNLGATVPAPWSCLAGTPVRPELTRQCAVQPMLTLSYQVAGLYLTGTAAPGSQLIKLTAGHLQLAGHPAITGATMQVSFDDGATWQPAQVTATGPGHFSAAFTAPAGAFVTLRVTVRDQAGGSITQTVQRAYQTAS